MLYQDSKTNKVYFSNILQNKYSNFAQALFKILDKYHMNYELINNTKDIWMRDYMPIQTSNDSFVRYIHKPDYLQGFSKVRTNPKQATKFLVKKNIIDIKLNLDGGNIVRAKNKIICTDKIFKANRAFSRQEVLNTLKTTLKISEVIIVPEQPFDMTGHSDGLVRFINEDKVMISSYLEEDRAFEKKLIASLIKHKLEIVMLPPTGYCKDKDGAVWIPYINYMQVGSLIILPGAGLTADDEVIAFFKKHFPNCIIDYVDATKIIEQGGALNCISWNINENRGLNV